MAKPARRYLAGAGEVEGDLKVKMEVALLLNDKEAENISAFKLNNNIGDMIDHRSYAHNLSSCEIEA